MAYVYLVVEWDRIEKDKIPCKIGVTTGSIEKRIKKLQTGNASNLHLVAYHKTDTPFKIERMLHSHYSQKRACGEWFNLTDEDILKFNKVCDKKEEIIELLKSNTYEIDKLNKKRVKNGKF